jgi:hypothetical protein
MSDVLERFHKALVEEIRVRRPEYLKSPFTVAEIYQNLVPYGTHRDRIGVEMNGDYEDALTRMLAGEGGYLIIDSEDALRLLRQELSEANPNVGAYREFAAVDVRLDPGHIPAAAIEPSQTAAGPSGAEPTKKPPLSDKLDVSGLSPAPAVAKPSDSRSTPAAAKTDDSKPAPPDACVWCRAELPKKPHLRFCPFCGTDIRIVPCASCGEEVEPEWRFCIACGTEVVR